jgi:hypothetical protein
MISLTYTVDTRLIAVTLIALFLAGVLYNLLVSWLGPRKTGYTSLLVVGGVLFTLAGVAFICWQSAAIALLAFAASGAPMVLGDIYRGIKRNHDAIELMRQAAQEQ